MAPPKHRDRTGDLPTFVLAHILSLLPLRSAVRCAILSKAWMAACREMQARTSVLDLGREFADGLTPEQYVAAVDRILELHEAVELQSMQVFYPSRYDYQVRFRKWTDFAASKQVRKLEVFFEVKSCPILVSSFHWSSLTFLSLRWCILSLPLHHPIQLPSLQTLSLREVEITDDTVSAILQHCPLLAALDLTLCQELQDLKITSSSLRKLTIIHSGLIESVEIDSSSLKSFHFYDCTYDSLLVKDISSLDDVLIYGFGSNITAFLHVGALTLYGVRKGFIQFLRESMEKPPCTFHNLKKFHIILDIDCYYLEMVCDILHFCSFPALENLFIEFSREDNWYKVEQSSPLRSGNLLPKLTVVGIEAFAGSKRQLKVAEFFLGAAVGLEKLVLSAKGTRNQQLSGDDLDAVRAHMEAVFTTEILKTVFGLELVVCNAEDDEASIPRPPHAEVLKEIRKIPIPRSRWEWYG